MSGRQSTVCNVEFVCEFGLFISLLSGTLVLHQHWGKNLRKKSTRFSCKLCHSRNWMYLSFDINKFLWCEIQAVVIIYNIHLKASQTQFNSTFICIRFTLFRHVTDLKGRSSLCAVLSENNASYTPQKGNRNTRQITAFLNWSWNVDSHLQGCSGGNDSVSMFYYWNIWYCAELKFRVVRVN